MSVPKAVPFGFRKSEATAESDQELNYEQRCAATLPRQRKNVVQCMRDEYHMVGARSLTH